MQREVDSNKNDKKKSGISTAMSWPLYAQRQLAETPRPDDSVLDGEELGIEVKEARQQNPELLIFKTEGGRKSGERRTGGGDGEQTAELSDISFKGLSPALGR